MQPNNSRDSENGNVFMFILLGVVLFAALAFVIARGFRSDTTTGLSNQQLKLAASEIRGGAAQVSRAINRLLSKGVSEGDICVYNASYGGAGYKVISNNSSCSENKNRIFDPEGGNLTWKKLPSKWFLTSEPEYPDKGYYFVMCTNVEVTGQGTTTVPYGGDATTKDAIALLGPLKLDICRALNESMGIIEDTPPDAYGTTSTAVCNQAFGNNTFKLPAGTEIGFNLPERCFRDPAVNGYYYYYTILAR